MIYTKKGDEGYTTLANGDKVSKNNVFIEACGILDESTSTLGIAKAHIVDDFIKGMITGIQRDLSKIMSEISNTQEKQIHLIKEYHVSNIEYYIDHMTTQIDIGNEFILPGNTVLSACLDVARTIVRKAERRVITIKECCYNVNKYTIQYLNRLSDLLFVLARYCEEIDIEI